MAKQDRSKKMNISAANLNKKPMQEVAIADISELDNSKKIEIDTTKGAVHRSNLLLNDHYNDKLNLYCLLNKVKKQDVGFAAIKEFLDKQDLPELKIKS